MAARHISELYEQAWPHERRLAQMKGFIATMAAFGERAIDQIQPKKVAETYRVSLVSVEVEIAGHRTEGEGK